MSDGSAVLPAAFEVPSGESFFSILFFPLAPVGREETSSNIPFINLTLVERVTFSWKSLWWSSITSCSPLRKLEQSYVHAVPVWRACCAFPRRVPPRALPACQAVLAFSGTGKLRQLLAARLGIRRRSVGACPSSMPGPSQPQPNVPVWVQSTPALLGVAGTQRWAFSSWRLLALRQGGSRQGNSEWFLVSATVVCGIMGLSWVYPRRNAILDWVTCYQIDGCW